MSLEVEDRSTPALSEHRVGCGDPRTAKCASACPLRLRDRCARFRPGESDLDSVVEFLPMSHGDPADAYSGLLEDLAAPIDLVERAAVTNPFITAGADGYSFRTRRSRAYAHHG